MRKDRATPWPVFTVRLPDAPKDLQHLLGWPERSGRELSRRFEDDWTQNLRGHWTPGDPQCHHGLPVGGGVYQAG